MPGYVGIIPALGMLTPEDNPPDGPVHLNTGHLILWSLAVAYLGVFTAVPLRTHTVVREKLRFPSGAATAKVIQLMHNESSTQPYGQLSFSEEEEDDVEETGNTVDTNNRTRWVRLHV